MGLLALAQVSFGASLSFGCGCPNSPRLVRLHITHQNRLESFFDIAVLVSSENNMDKSDKYKPNYNKLMANYAL